MKDNNYYNKESSVYSKKRYPEKSTYFVHFLFKRRLQILIKYLQLIAKKKEMSLLEIGCADGFVSIQIRENTNIFDEIVGIDISPEMIRIANSSNKDKEIKFLIRNNDINLNRKFDVIVEVGVLNLVDLYSELNFVKNNLTDDGIYICSVASRTSLLNKLKSEGERDFRHFHTFKEYEREIRRYFLITKSISYGLFIPYIWKMPVFAHLFQVIIEKILKDITPNLFHEKIYFLKKV
jgi:SAM-dependent methyltransferase